MVKITWEKNNQEISSVIEDQVTDSIHILSAVDLFY